VSLVLLLRIRAQNNMLLHDQKTLRSETLQREMSARVICTCIVIRCMHSFQQ
jgi:hypothetical protein